jgi:hypothetical protein
MDAEFSSYDQTAMIKNCLSSTDPLIGSFELPRNSSGLRKFELKPIVTGLHSGSSWSKITGN